MTGTAPVHTYMVVLRVGLVALLVAVALVPRPAAQSLPHALFERYLESLRQQTAIPGLSAVIVQGRQVVWEAGLGRQDVENNVAARADTPYLIGGLSQTVGAVVLGQCVQRRGLNIDAPIGRWTSNVTEPGATIRHVMAHTSSGVPGEAFLFNPARYASLVAVADDCAERPYRRTVAEDIFDRLGMQDSLPGRDLERLAATPGGFFDNGRLTRYEGVLRRFAVPYRVDRSGKATRGEYPADAVSTADGLISSARDLARFDAALDGDALIPADLRDVAWTNATTQSGAPLPTGLGWMVQQHNGERLVWHFGLVPDAASSLILKVPSRDLTLILLANSDGLSAAYGLSNGDVTTSLFAKLFLRLFVP